MSPSAGGRARGAASESASAGGHAPRSGDPRSLTRPDPALLTYYIVVSVLSLIAFPFVFLPLWFRYRTLEYRFDEDGVAMAWGRFFRREVYLTYRRVQDIHVTRNVLHRWLGLGSVSLQTASGSAGAEMTIEGLRDPEALRDFLYARMRGAEGDAAEGAEAGAPAVESPSDPDEALELLREIRDLLRDRAERR